MSASEQLSNLKLANKFLKVTRNYKLESERPDKLPDDLMASLAGAELETYIKDNNMETEGLIWGLLQMVEMLMKYAELTPEELSESTDKFIEFMEQRDSQDE